MAIFDPIREWLASPTLAQRVATLENEEIQMTDQSKQLTADVAQIKQDFANKQAGWATQLASAVAAAKMAQQAADESANSEVMAAVADATSQLEALHKEMSPPVFTPSGNVPLGG